MLRALSELRGAAVVAGGMVSGVAFAIGALRLAVHNHERLVAGVGSLRRRVRIERIARRLEGWGGEPAPALAAVPEAELLAVTGDEQVTSPPTRAAS